MNRILSFVFFALCVSTFSLAQHNSYLEDVRALGGSSIETPDYSWKGKDVTLVINEASQFLVDSVDAVSSEAVAVMSLAALNSTDSHSRRRVVELLTKALVHNGISTASTANRYLAKFSQDDFTKEAVDSLDSFLLDARHYNYIKVARMAAEKGIGTNALSQAFHSGGLKLQKKWDVSICLARLDYDPATQWIIGKIERADNPFVVIEMSKDLVYTQQPSLIDLCVNVLKNKGLKCESVNPNISTKIDCGYRLMEIVGPVIKDFPVKFDDLGMLGSDQEYEEALLTVRQWLDKNPDYELIFDTAN